jgi:autotransporter-associated beta strand protein
MALFYEKGSSSPYETITLARFNADWLDVTPPPAENPGAALWNFEENPVGQIVSTAKDALLDVHPEGHALHMTATAAFPVIAGAPAYGNGRALNITGNGGARILDSETANRFDFGANQSFTIEIVCRIPSGSTQVGALVAKDLAALSPSWWLRVENGKARFLVADNTAEPNISSAASINTGQWVHIAAVRDATHPASKQLRVYVNGTLSGSTTDTTTASLANGQAVWIGRYNAGTRLLTGDVDFVRITPQALAPADFANASTQFPDPAGQAADLIWTGATNAAWDIATTANWKKQSGAAVTYHDGDQVTFDSSAGTTTVNLAGTAMPGAVIFDFDTPASYQLGGSMGIGGVAGLRKLGTGTLSMSNANSYTGATTISAGTLTVTGSLGHTAVTVADGATLAGNGNLGGSVTIQSGGIHSLMIGSTPATQITRTVSGALVLDAGNILTLTAAQLPANGTYILAIATGGISGTLGTANLPAGVPGSVVINGNNIELTIGSDYDIWAGPSGFDLTGGPNGDDDTDGLSNFQEYAFGLDPTNGHGISPVTVPDKPAGTFTYTRRKPSLTGLEYTSQSSSTLEGWTDFPNPVFETSDNADPVETITVTIPATLLAEPKIFLRVRAKE